MLARRSRGEVGRVLGFLVFFMEVVGDGPYLGCPERDALRQESESSSKATSVLVCCQDTCVIGLTFMKEEYYV